MTSINSLCANDHNRDVKSDSEASEDPGNGGVYRPHVPAQSGGKKEEGSLEHHRETLDEPVQWPFLKPIAFALTVSATLDRRPAFIAQVPVQPLLPQHGDEGGQQGDKETRVHEAGDGDDLTWQISLNR